MKYDCLTRWNIRSFKDMASWRPGDNILPQIITTNSNDINALLGLNGLSVWYICSGKYSFSRLQNNIYNDRHRNSPMSAFVYSCSRLGFIYIYIYIYQPSVNEKMITSKLVKLPLRQSTSIELWASSHMYTLNETIVWHRQGNEGNKKSW